MTNNKFINWFGLNWDKVLSISIAVLSLAIASSAWYNQHEAANKYRENTRQVLRNSADLALFDIDLLAQKAKMSEEQPIKYAQLEYQIESLEQNLKVIESIQITNLPKKESMNYQVYRADLYNVIYRVKSSISDLRDLANPTEKAKSGTDDVAWSKQNRLTFISELILVREVIKERRDALTKNENLYDIEYKKATKVLESNVDELKKQTTNQFNKSIIEK